MNQIDERAAAEGVKVIDPPRRLFQPYVLLGDTIFSSGHTSDQHGVLGVDADVTLGRRAAQQAVVKLLSAILTERGTLKNLRFASLRVYVKSAPDFTTQPLIADAASELIDRVFGPELGAHSRSAIGVAALPHGVAVEVEAILQEITPD